MNDQLSDPERVPLLDESDFEPEFIAACRNAREWMAGTASSPGEAEVWKRAVREVHERVFALRLLRPSACKRLLTRIDEARSRALARGAEIPAPNSMHAHGVVLDPLGFEPLLHDLMTRWVRPFAARLLPEFGGDRLDAHHGYLVEYARDKDEFLGFHVDDSEVTLNVCLGESFEGAELTMLGLRCDVHLQTSLRPHEYFEFQHEIGVAVLHAGHHRHRVEPLRRGVRRNLILWCRDSSQRKTRQPLACTAWCGLGQAGTR